MGAAPDIAAGGPVGRDLSELRGPRSWPLVGNLLQLDRARVHHTVEQWALRYGPVFRIRLGPTPFLVVADHEAIGAVLRDRPDGFRRPPRLEIIWREMGFSPGLFGANGDAWRRQRRMVMAGFDPAHVRAYVPALSRVTQRLRQRWMLAAQHERPIDLQSDLMRFTVDAIAGLAFGTEVNTLESDEVVIQHHLDQIFPAVARRMLAPFPYWRYLKTPADRRLDSAVREVNRAVADFIARARTRLAASAQRRDRPENLLEAMLLAADMPGSGMDDRDVAGNVLTMLLAGEDTTANTLAWLLHLLRQNLALYGQVQQEVRDMAAAAGGGPEYVFSHDELDRLPLLEACIHETMRLKPVGPLNLMQALRDTQVAGVRVPAGALLWCVMRHDTLRETLFADAQRFDPARWLAGGDATASASSAKRVSMPFGAGPRICPGRYLALLEMKMALAMLLSSFDIDSVQVADGSEPRERLSFTMAPVGLLMRLQLRDGQRSHN